ncbi:hypothetical protein DET49_12434 [Salegentibacter sp. 24]|uniref:hypothetical protein n=1 Tax=Salegentibacter sp. 24 TaxID=2183986 RepID=UPI00105D91A8|nr:hypothetical protein [Salegentibacter sp. 24]TDN82381.1 hypothetical protein DET49_12434 [Salegentibacter sp. 24]
MKTIAILLSLFLSNLAFGKMQETRITCVNAENLSWKYRKVCPTFFTKDNFFQKAPVQAEVYQIKDGRPSITFPEIPINTFEITFLDKMENQKMDFKTNRTPNEDLKISTI